MRWRRKSVYLFSGILDQEKTKLDLILNVIGPKIGGETKFKRELEWCKRK